MDYDMDKTEIGNRIVDTIREIKEQSCLVARLKERRSDVAFSLRQIGKVLEDGAEFAREREGSIEVKWTPDTLRTQTLMSFPTSKEVVALFNEHRAQVERLEALKEEHAELTELAEGV